MPAFLALVAEPLSLLVWVWVVFSVVFMGPRCLVLVARSRGEAWLVTGVPAGRR